MCSWETSLWSITAARDKERERNREVKELKSGVSLIEMQTCNLNKAADFGAVVIKKEGWIEEKDGGKEE